ncbi:RNA polymerase sigma factor [Variovorax sp. CYS-02]|uniref:RNA polymerase sigma factor n=2 Tax=Variovorax terrae TaxID=2923278 RepID=A0A9X1VQZ7_9BURK|nr:RNA polymerase sigma factor [Variovorax terrae]MCJ0761770.1 RNA polymerase sigma factor [Variovorax terrae]
MPHPLPHARPEPSDRATDGELAARAAQGDARAFEHIMRRHNRLLFRTARSVLKSDAETEDAVQEGYLSAWRALGSFRGEARLSTWLVRIVLNEALGRVRRPSAKVIALDLAMGAPPPEREPEDAMEADHDQQPDRLAARAEIRRLLEARIDALPEVFRTVFVLRAVEELTVEETATALGVPEATVRTRLFRARSLLRESLSRDLDFAMEDAFSFAGARCDRIVARVLARIAPGGSPPSFP